MGLQSDTERKGEVKVANSNSHYWKINISISDHGDFLNYLPCPWTRHSTFLVTFSYFYSSTCKLEKHPQKRSPTLLPWTLLTDFNNESCTKKEKANDTELRADFECRYFCPVLSSSVATWPNNNTNAFDCLTYEGGHSNQCKTSFSFSELLATWERVMDSLMKSCCFGAKIGLVVISHWQERNNLCLLEFIEKIWPRSLVQWLTP